jgi:hypothetical protein
MENSTIIIAKEMNAQEFVNSNYATVLGAWYAEESNERSKKAVLKRNGKIFIEEVDAENNYGRSFKAWERYTIDGLNFFQELDFGGAMISSGGFYTASSINFNMPMELLNDKFSTMPHINKIYINRSECYANCEKNREIWKKDEFTTLTKE